MHPYGLLKGSAFYFFTACPIPPALEPSGEWMNDRISASAAVTGMPKGGFHCNNYSRTGVSKLFSEKGQIINSLGFASHRVSV